MKKILVVLAHPNYKDSVINRKLIEQVKTLEHVTVSALYTKYPDGEININAEQKLIVEHDLVVLQFPFYWFNTTPLMKQWIDEVFSYNFAYGPDGDKLNGKDIMLCITIGSDKERYINQVGFTLSDLLKPFEYSAKYCNAIYHQPFVVATVNKVDDGFHTEAKLYAQFLTNYGLKGCSAFVDDYPSF